MDLQIIWDELPLYFDGLLLTIQLVPLSLLIGFVIAVPLAVMRLSKNPFVNYPVFAFTYAFRGTPLIVQLFILYYGVGTLDGYSELTKEFNFLKGAYFFALLGFTLNTAAYTAEIFRGAMAQTSFGEVEAAKACGMSQFLIFRRIIIPSALRRALPAYSNEVIFMLHGSALASTITLVDLTGAARIVQSRYYAPYEAFITAAVFYFVLTFLFIWLFRLVENHYNRHLKRREETIQVVT
ncbi:amino acid ABC transporter permease [Kiloniella litopenaei]|uniref:Amino acid ABC transporter permease n=1 Tax=Kiloniella litopenaei TaxID=1549748 RepID=A0A0M2R6H4_9PROT|nr:ABC transporter permease [Kiloniella litopenaei]KKJ76044.1 amino acid ABC transporter permease [Kiloniella litopenaei]